MRPTVSLEGTPFGFSPVEPEPSGRDPMPDPRCLGGVGASAGFPRVDRANICTHGHRHSTNQAPTRKGRMVPVASWGSSRHLPAPGDRGHRDLATAPVGHSRGRPFHRKEGRMGLTCN